MDIKFNRGTAIKDFIDSEINHKGLSNFGLYLYELIDIKNQIFLNYTFNW